MNKTFETSLFYYNLNKSDFDDPIDGEPLKKKLNYFRSTYKPHEKFYISNTVGRINKGNGLRM